MNHTPQPSEPTQPFGAPHIGLDWTWGSPEGRPAAWQAFGDDHGLELRAPYEPDWWCLVHNRSGTGPGCPDCNNTTDPTSQGAAP